MSSPINVNIPAMPMPTGPPASNNFNDENIWSLNLRRNIRRLPEQKRQKIMDEIDLSVTNYVRDVLNDCD